MAGTPRKPHNKNVEKEYRRKLNKVARHIGELIASYDPLTPEKVQEIQRIMDNYSQTLEGWAANVAYRMVHHANKKDEKWWNEIGKNISNELRNSLKRANVQPYIDQMVREQVELITSLPTEAAQRASNLAQRTVVAGQRASEVSKELQKTGEVTESRARLIARTEVARTSSTLTQARASALGSVEYIWRTAGDSDVRLGHKEVANNVYRWDNPPAVNEGTRKNPRIMHHHPGEIWNCRCYPEPILPE